MFAVHIILNEKGRKKVAESIQGHIDEIKDLQKFLERYEIKDEYVKSIEIINSVDWNGWKH